MPHPKSEVIRKFIIDQVENHPADITKLTGEHFNITRQAVRRHLTTLIEDGILAADGETRNRRYSLNQTRLSWDLLLHQNKDEDKVWRDHLESHIENYPTNIQKICHYGFTEMFNNAIDHSGGTKAIVILVYSAKKIGIQIEDDGIGIFEKLKTAFGHEDYRQSALELSMGKLTTDSSRHTGQGIFFSSRSFDYFDMCANGHAFCHNDNLGNWILEDAEPSQGTTVSMLIDTDSRRTLREIFDRYTNLDDDDYPFSKTHAPLSLARYGDEMLVSRSQAKRVLARFGQFEEVILDFSGIDEIGQAFADEIFRVFGRNNPQIKLVHIYANEQVQSMIRRAESTPVEPTE